MTLCDWNLFPKVHTDRNRSPENLHSGRYCVKKETCIFEPTIRRIRLTEKALLWRNSCSKKKVGRKDFKGAQHCVHETNLHTVPHQQTSSTKSNQRIPKPKGSCLQHLLKEMQQGREDAAAPWRAARERSRTCRQGQWLLRWRRIVLRR